MTNSNYIKISNISDDEAIRIGAIKHPSGVWIIEKEKYSAYLATKNQENMQVIPDRIEPDQSITNDIFWDNYTADDSLQYLLSIKKQGMPSSAENRTSLLRAISNRTPGHYPITYEGMCQYSQEFAVLYSQERVLGLIRRCITGAKPFMEEIQSSDLSPEEKALLMFVLPL